jgi:hypothetical protein
MTKSQELEPGAADQAINDWPVRTAVSLTLPETLTFDEWQEIGRKICKASTSLRWYIGDWLLHGERKWGEMYSEAMRLTGLSYDTLAHCKSIAAKFEPWRRRQKLRWSYHREVGDLSIENQDRMLNEIDAARWSRERLRHEVATAQRQEKETKIELARSAMTPAERAQIARERDERVAALDAELRAVTTAAVGHMVDLQRSVDGIPPPLKLAPPDLKAKPIDLDTSNAAAPVPEALRNLEVEPSPPVDRVAIAKAAIDALPFDHKLVLFAHWFSTLRQAEKNEVYECVLLHSERTAFLIDKLHD